MPTPSWCTPARASPLPTRSPAVFGSEQDPGLRQAIRAGGAHASGTWDPQQPRHITRAGEDQRAALPRSITIGDEVIVPGTAGPLDLGPWQRIFYGERDGRR